MRRYWIPLATLGIILIAAATLVALTYDNVGSQSPPNTFTGWPPFVAVFEKPGSPVSTSKGVVDTGTITRRLVWNAPRRLESHDDSRADGYYHRRPHPQRCWFLRVAEGTYLHPLRVLERYHRDANARRERLRDCRRLVQRHCRRAKRGIETDGQPRRPA